MNELIAELGSLAEKLSAGWHEGIEIDASDIMLMNKTVTALEQQAAEITEFKRRDDLLSSAMDKLRINTSAEIHRYIAERDAALAEIERLKDALDCDRAILKARTESRNALQAKLSAMEGQEPVVYRKWSSKWHEWVYDPLCTPDSEPLYTAPKVEPLTPAEASSCHETGVCVRSGLYAERAPKAPAPKVAPAPRVRGYYLGVGEGQQP